MRRLLVSVLWLVVVACATDVVDFAPPAAPTRVDVVTLGDVPPDDIVQLQNATKVRRDDKQLVLLHPLDGAVLPNNLAAPLWSWRSGKPDKMPMMPMAPEAMTYELTLWTGDSELRIYTRASTARIPVERWRALLSRSDGGTLSMRVRALSSSPRREVIETSPAQLSVVGPVPAGSLYFVSSGQLLVTRLDAELSRAVAYADMSTHCGDGHAVSRDGGYLGSACAAGTGGVWTLPMLQSVLTLPMSADVASFGSFSPDGRRFVRTRAGQLELLETNTGRLLETLAPLASAMGTQFAQPDWSPDGRSIACMAWSTPTSAPVLDDTSRPGASIVRLTLTSQPDGSERFTEPTMLASPTGMGMSSLIAPRYAPDGTALVYESRSDKPEQTELLRVPAEGGGSTRLVEARAGDRPDKKRITMSPSWLPAADPGHAWLLFSSTHEVGTSVGHQQLWLGYVALAPAANEPALARALLLPGQPLDTDNERALFAPDR